jgi:hypothetical protein
VREAAGTLDLTPGSALVIDSAEWTVERLEPQCGRVLLMNRSGGNRMWVNVRVLVNHPANAVAAYSACRPTSLQGCLPLVEVTGCATNGENGAR